MVCVNFSLALPPVDLLNNCFEHILMVLMFTRTEPHDANIYPNSSEGGDPSSSEGVNLILG